MPTKNNNLSIVSGGETKRLIPLTEWSNFHQWPTEAALRKYVYERNLNGFSSCLRRVGSRWLIIEDEFFNWVDAQSVKAGLSC